MGWCRCRCVGGAVALPCRLSALCGLSWFFTARSVWKFKNRSFPFSARLPLFKTFASSRRVFVRKHLLKNQRRRGENQKATPTGVGERQYHPEEGGRQRHHPQGKSEENTTTQEGKGEKGSITQERNADTPKNEEEKTAPP